MRTIFVFGSNLAGIHGAGAALAAKVRWGAHYGRGVGRTGEAYAIPTKDANIKTLPPDVIRGYVKSFLAYAREHPELRFFVTRVGCGLAGYDDSEMAPMFADAPTNCHLPGEWVEILYRKK